MTIDWKKICDDMSRIPNDGVQIAPRLFLEGRLRGENVVVHRRVEFFMLGRISWEECLTGIIEDTQRLSSVTAERIAEMDSTFAIPHDLLSLAIPDKRDIARHSISGDVSIQYEQELMKVAFTAIRVDEVLKENLRALLANSAVSFSAPIPLITPSNNPPTTNHHTF